MATMADAVRKRTANQKASAEATSQSPVRNWIQKNFTNVYAEPAATPKVEIKETAPATNAMAAAVRRRTAGQTSVATAQPSVTQRAQEWITNRKSELQTQISSYESALEKLRGAPTVAARLQNELNRTGVSGTTSFNPLGGVTAKADVYGAAKAKQGGIEELERELANLRHDLQELDDPSKAELLAWGAIKEEDQRAHRQQAIATASDATQNAGYLGTSFVGGLTDVMGGFYNAADAILPDRNAAGERINTPRIDAFQKAKGQLEDTVADYGAEVSPAMQKYGGMIARGVGYTLPSTVLAMLPGVQALSASAGGNVLANPQFWFSAIPMYGNGYQQAKESGATEQEAQWFAALNAFAGAAVEIGGGVQKIPTEAKTLLTWIRGALEESGEEVLQGIIEGLASKVTYDADKEFASWTDPDAIFSGSRAAQEALSGLLVGGILGGGQVMAGAALNYGAVVAEGNRYIQATDGHSIDEALQIGLSNAKGTDAYAAALKLQERVNNRQEISPYAVGRMVMESQSDAAVQARAIEQTVLQSAERTRYPTESAENIAAAAVKLGQATVFGDAAQFNPGQAAYYDHDNQVVVLNPNANEKTLEGYVLAHEMVHSAQATQQWATLENTVRQMVGDTEWSAYQARVRESYAGHGIQLNDTQVRQEAMAQWVGENLFKQGFAQAVAKGDAKTGGILLRGLDKLRRAVGIKNSPSARDIAMLERLVMQAMENRTGTRSGDGVQYAQDNVPVIEISANSELAKRIEGLTGKPKYKIIYQYILENLGGNSIVLSDGKSAIVENRDIQHIGKKANENKVAMLSEIKKIIESAQLIAEEDSTKYKKFDYFYYYETMLKSENEIFPIYVNVGRNRYTGKFHIYDFTQNLRDTAHRINDVGRPGGYALGNDISNTTVAQNADGVNTQSMQNGGGNTQSAYISEDQFVDRMGVDGQSPSHGDAVTAPFTQGGHAADAAMSAVQVDEGAVLESAVRSQMQGKTVAQGRDIDSIAAEIGEDEMLRRMYNATQMDRPKGSVTINGQTVDANAYVDAYEQSLPDDPAALQEHIRRLEQQRTEALLQMEREGTLEEYTRGGLKLDLQLFAANRKWELLQLDPEEGGKKTRQFFEKRLRGTDANHHEELVELLAGRSENYNPISTQKQLDRANNRLMDSKYQQKLIKRIGRYNPRDLFSPVDVAASQLLINKALNEGEYEVAADLIAGLSRKGTELGRAVQAFSIMARLTPEGTLRMAQRTMKAEADYIIGEGASEGLDMLADDIADAIREAVRKGISGDEIADRIRNGRPRGDVDMIPYGAMQTQEGTADGGETETRQTGMKPFEGMEPYAEPTYVDGVVQNTAPMTRSELVNALVDDLAAEERNYLNREQIKRIVQDAVAKSTNIPEQVKRYVLKKIRKNDGALANRIYEVYRKGDLSQVKLRRAMEEALELPTLSDGDIVTLVEMATRCQELAEDPIAQADAMDDMYDFLAAKMSVNGWDKLQAWRKFGMLANVKTHARNIGSNFAYGGVRKMDDALSMALERMFRVKPEERAAYLGWSHTEHGQSILPALQKKADTAVLEMQKRGAKYETGSGQLKQRRKHFGTGKVGEKLNAANRWNSDLLEQEDVWFFRPAYIDALGQMMTAQGATEISDAMHEKAMQRALEATFRADNAISEVFSNLKRFQNDSKAGLRLFGHAMDVVVPFHKTPANIATQTVMHSPIGIVKGAFDLYNATKGKGSKDAATAINTMAKGITGSALLAIGILLGKAGLFNTGFGKTEKERAADELAGLQENAFVFGDVSISFDWLQPAASPLIVGASIGKRLADEDMNLGAVFGAVMDGTDSLFEMTMLQSLYDILGGYDAGATATAASVVENVVSQSIPTLVGQAARAIDPVQRKTTADSEFMTIVNQVVAKIPGLTYILDPELDVWGNEVYRTGKPGAGTAALNAIQQFILPSNVKVGTGRGDRISAEILRLYRSVDKQPSRAIPGAVSRDDAKDGGMDHVEINRRLGQVNRQAVEDFINNQWPYAVQVDAGNGKTKKETKYYRNMTDEERVRVLSRIYTNTKKTVTEPDAESSGDSYFEEIFRRLQ